MPAPSRACFCPSKHTSQLQQVMGPVPTTRSATKASSASSSSPALSLASTPSAAPALSSAPVSPPASALPSPSATMSISPSPPPLVYPAPHIEQLSADIPPLDAQGTNWAVFEARFQDTM